MQIPYTPLRRTAERELEARPEFSHVVVNDRLEDAAALVRVAREVKAKVNCIPYNKVEGLEWKRPSETRQDAFMAVLAAARIPATIRREKGHDIDAACGQLRRRVTAEL